MSHLPGDAPDGAIHIDAPSLPEDVVAALRAILAGSTADASEGQHLDFKEDPARSAKPHGNPDARRLEMLLDAVVCFANADGEAHVILGVADKLPGPTAFTGTDADAATLRRRIFDRTSPSLTVDIHEVHVGATRLLHLRIPQGISVYSRKDGAASVRVGTSCEPLSDLARRELAFARANPDATARPSRLSPADLDPLAVATARRLLAQRAADSPPTSDEDVLRRIGVLTTDGVLLEAGAILLGPAEEHRVIARHLWRRTPSGEPAAVEYTRPTLLAMAHVKERVQTLVNPELTRVELSTGQEMPIPDFPSSAIDEAVSNAFIHRDWTSQLPIVVSQSPIGLSVDSPGGLPFGVREDRLLTTRSMPRNVALMRALHTLGLAEETSRGFDRMWASMLRTGRATPHVRADDFHVEVTFSAGQVDAEFVQWLSQLITDGVDPETVQSLNCLVALQHLKAAPTLSLGTASRLMQTGADEAGAQLTWLSSAELLEPAGAADEWQLSQRARSSLAAVGGSAPLAGALEAWILQATQAGAAVTNRQVVEATGAPAREVTRTLRYLADTRRIAKDPDSPTRGPGVRWRRG